LATVSRNFLKNSTHIFKWAEITLSRNKTIFDFLVFFIMFFLTSPGTLLPDHLEYFGNGIC
jgi:hypothetical protein